MRIRACVLLIALVLSLAPAPARGIMVAPELRQTVTTSEVIVIATLQDLRTEQKNGYDYWEGDLVVEQVIWGNAKPGDRLPLRWRATVGVMCGNPEHHRSAGLKLLWLLSRDARGGYNASHGGVMPVEELPTVVDTLAAYPYHVIAPDRDAGEPVGVAVEFRNATTSNLTVPAFRTIDGVVTHGDGFALIPRMRMNGREAAPLTLRSDAPLRHDPGLAPVVLAPGESVRVDIPFSEMFTGLGPGRYGFQVEVNGRRTEHRFRIRTPWEGRLERVRDTPAEAAFYLQTIRERAPESSAALSMLRMNSALATSVASDMMRLCDSLETTTRRDLIYLIGHVDIEPEERLDFLLDRIDDPDPVVAAAALSGAVAILSNMNVQYRRDEVIEHLILRLGEEDAAARREAASALASLRAVAAVPDLHRLVSVDGDAEVRRSAQWAIDRIEGRNCCSCAEKAKVLP